MAVIGREAAVRPLSGETGKTPSLDPTSAEQLNECFVIHGKLSATFGQFRYCSAIPRSKTPSGISVSISKMRCFWLSEPKSEMRAADLRKDGPLYSAAVMRPTFGRSKRDSKLRMQASIERSSRTFPAVTHLG
jgi:hypothetical protein